MHEVYFDKTYIYGVTNVDEGSDRNITVYDGLEQGNFPIADSRKLHTWTVQCELTEQKESKHNDQWTEARNLFKKFESALNTQGPKRLIITADYGKTSKQVLLESYTKAEKYKGVYDVTLKFMEYVEVGIRTEDVPYIPRPGKVPAPPKTVVFNGKDSTPYSVQSKYTNGMSISQFNQLKYTEPNTGKIFSNLCTIADGSKVALKPIPKNALEAALYGAKDILDAPKKWILSAAEAMANANDNYKKKWDEENKARIASLK
ncbi:hypothetical protein [Hydrogenoanaerobacterium sp.]|uniref:hypothetical protein n=1 Tax=Hydrogenoanaerobacterium sp. TaxID=2953763 RepID=UPI00289C9A66|nr:hypothetical protein [Hydrogenoanaerobacterium sp.]